VSGGGQIYKALISKVGSIQLSTVHTTVESDIVFPEVPEGYELVYKQYFKSNTKINSLKTFILATIIFLIAKPGIH